MRRLIFGCGYLGSRVAQRWHSAGDEIHVVTRSAERAAALRSLGYVPHIADITDARSLSRLPLVESVLFAVGFDRNAGKSIFDVYVDGLRNALAIMPDGLNSFVYISSTGVYGPGKGELIDEDSPCQPTRDGGKACLAAEDMLRSGPLADRAKILRLAGIYGPGRTPRTKDLISGEPLAVDRNSWLNLIHVEDAADLVLAVESQTPGGTLLVASDGAPVRRGDYLAEAARLIGAAPPRFLSSEEIALLAGASPQVRGGDKRANIARLKGLLPQFQPRFPDYIAGLADCLGPASGGASG